MEQLESEPTPPINRIVQVADDVLAAIGPDKELWRLDIPALQAHPDLQDRDGLEVLGVLERSSSEQLELYGARRQSNPRVGTIATAGLREARRARADESLVETPFGTRLGQGVMGTPHEVLGKEAAEQLLQRLDDLEHQNRL